MQKKQQPKLKRIKNAAKTGDNAKYKRQDGVKRKSGDVDMLQHMLVVL